MSACGRNRDVSLFCVPPAPRFDSTCAGGKADRKPLSTMHNGLIALARQGPRVLQGDELQAAILRVKLRHPG